MSISAYILTGLILFILSLGVSGLIGLRVSEMRKNVDQLYTKITRR